MAYQLEKQREASPVVYRSHGPLTARSIARAQKAAKRSRTTAATDPATTSEAAATTAAAAPASGRLAKRARRAAVVAAAAAAVTAQLHAEAAPRVSFSAGASDSARGQNAGARRVRTHTPPASPRVAVHSVASPVRSVSAFAHGGAQGGPQVRSGMSLM